MAAPNLVVVAALGYVAALFALAWTVDRRAARGGGRWVASPLVYTLSLSVYCTAWTFYGAVGSAARSGAEFITIYLGPTLVFVGWWWLIRKLVRIGRTHRITSIADMISSRYGKSGALAAIATVGVVAADAPYIALQLQSLTLSFEAITGATGREATVAFWAAALLALFTILFGTRTLDESERHHGVVAAIAAEAVVKLGAIIAVGWFAVFSAGGGLGGTFAHIRADGLNLDEALGVRWTTLLFLSATAVICLPRQFQVTVVENADESHVATASWLFPLYMFLISLFVLPLAAVGAATLPAGANPDLYVLALPLHHGREALATLAFIGGLSAATSMVIVSTIALSTMVSNHVVAPLALRLLPGRGNARSGDVLRMVLTARRLAMVVILALGYAYLRLAGQGDTLASTGLIAFCGVAQLLPPLLAGVFWRNATRDGAIAGLVAGFGLWAYTLYLPSLGALPAAVMDAGPFGLAALRPQALFGTGPADALVHAAVWSLGANVACLVLVSLMTGITPLERLQGALFVDAFRSEPATAMELVRRSAPSGDLFVLAQRVLGTEPAATIFHEAAVAQGRAAGLPDPTPAFISRLERELAGSIGAASAHAMVGRLAGGETISTDRLIEIAGESARLRRASEALQAKTAEAELTAAELRAANARLMTLDAQKDEFLSHVSHELRTPMTSVRSFAEILRDNPEIDAASRAHFAEIIQAESLRLTRLIDEIHDLTFLDRQAPEHPVAPVDPEAILDNAVEIALAPFAGRDIELRRAPAAAPVRVAVAPDPLAQVFINVLTNAVVHNDKPRAEIAVRSGVARDGAYVVEVEDNGPGVDPAIRARVVEPFFRGSRAGGSGLGLAISARILEASGGALEIGEGAGRGAKFSVRLPVARPDRR